MNQEFFDAVQLMAAEKGIPVEFVTERFNGRRRFKRIVEIKQQPIALSVRRIKRICGAVKHKMSSQASCDKKAGQLFRQMFFQKGNDF